MKLEDIKLTWKNVLKGNKRKYIQMEGERHEREIKGKGK